MDSSRTSKEKRKKLLVLDKDDLDYLERRFGNTSEVLRKLVKVYVEGLRERENEGDN